MFITCSGFKSLHYLYNLQVITRGPRENHQIEEELHPQALVYRNLWLEAEAPMCALSMEF